MNIQPYKTPPRMWDAKLTPWIVNLCRPLQQRILKRTQRITDIEVRGLEHLSAALAGGCGVMITPNHSSHTDPPVLYEAAFRAGTHLHFMAAWQVFARTHWLRQQIFQRHGCFSVDREGTDRRAFRRAVEILKDRPQPLVIFGEGEVYHVNDRLTPFRDGPAAIAIAAAKHATRPIVCLPCAMKFVYTDDPTEALCELMSRLEARILWRPRPEMPLPERIQRYATGLLGVKEVEYMGMTQRGDLPERITSLAEFVLGGIESRCDNHAVGGDLPQRVQSCRRELIGQLEQDDPQALQQVAIDLSDLFMVIQLFSYPGDYVAAKPSIERMAETLDKFEEDILQVPTATVRGHRRAIVAFGEPVSPGQFNADDKKTNIASLTSQLERAIQSLLDAINRSL